MSMAALRHTYPRPFIIVIKGSINTDIRKPRKNMLIRVIGKAVLFPDNVSLSLTFYGYFKRQPAFDSSPLRISLYPVHLISVIFQNKSFHLVSLPHFRCKNIACKL